MDALSRKQERNKYMKQWNKKNKERIKKYPYNWNATRAVRTTQYRRNMKKTIIDYYGGKCVCCGESRYEFLTIDHINGGGSKQKAAQGFTGSGFYLWIIRNNFPSNLRILCWNCNCALGIYGYCPHGNVTKGNMEEQKLDKLPLFEWML